jgi:hypothetical protein
MMKDLARMSLGRSRFDDTRRAKVVWRDLLHLVGRTRSIAER